MNSTQSEATGTSLKVHFRFKMVEIFELDISDSEPIGELRTLLNDHPFLRLHPHFKLTHKGQRLSDTLSLGAQIPKAEQPLVIEVVLDKLTNQTAERHVSQAADFFLHPAFYLNESFIDFNVFLGRPDFVQNMITRQEVPLPEISLEDIVKNNVQKVGQTRFLSEEAPPGRFFVSFGYSRYNPPLSNFLMQDDLFYLDCVLKEGRYVCLTAHKKGFFANESTATVFSQKPASAVFPSIFDLLSELSPGFKTDLETIIKFDSQEAHDLLMNSPSILPSPNDDPRTFSEVDSLSQWTCALTQLRQTLSEYRNGTNLKVYRDWNEEFQSYRALAVTDNMQQLQKTKILRKVYRDFAKSAQEVCKAIVNNHFQAVNQTDKRVEECYVFNNFFITYAEDRLDWETPRQETTPSTYSNINSDLKNLQQIYSLDLPGVNVINTCAVDYLGLRLVVQTMITGILHFDQKTWNCYGSIDDGKTFNDNGEFAPTFEELCKNFKLKLNCVFKDANGKEFKIHGSPEVKGIKAGDGRKYVMDLMKLSPRDLNFPRAKEDEGCLVRPELIRNYLFINSIEEMYAKNGEGKEQASEVEGETAKPQDQPTQDPKSEVTKPASKSSKMDYFNPNIGSMIENEDDGLKVAETEQLKSVASFIVDNAIPFFKSELGSNPTSGPIDMEGLIELLHKYGINVRYLGRILTQLDQPADKFFRVLLEKTILIRSLRKYFRKIALEMSVSELVQVITHFLNCVLGDSDVRGHIDQRVGTGSGKGKKEGGEANDRTAVNGKKKKGKKKRTVASTTGVSENNGEYLKLSCGDVFEKVAKIAQTRYGADFSKHTNFDSFACLATGRDKVAFLREFARSMGLILVSRQYTFSMPSAGFDYPIRFKDWIGVSPRVKSPNFHIDGLKYSYKSIEGEINDKNFDSALNMLSSCQSIIVNTYGLFNNDFIYVTSKIASLMFLKGQTDRAVRTQALVVRVSERVFGIDHFNTAFSIIELSNYIFETRKFEQSIALHSLAVLVFDLVGGPLNPSSLLCLQEMHLLFAQTKKLGPSADAMEELLRRNERIFGETDEHLLFLLGKLAAMKGDLGDFKEASILQARKSLILKRLLLNSSAQNDDYARKIIDEKITDSEYVKNVFVQKYKELEAGAVTGNTAENGSAKKGVKGAKK